MEKSAPGFASSPAGAVDPDPGGCPSFTAHLPDLAAAGRQSKLHHRGFNRPLALMVETTNICNNACVVCPYVLQTRKRRIMTMDTFRNALAGYRELGGGALSFTPLVGDVLLDKHLFERLALVQAEPAMRPLSVTTNGVLFDLYSDDEVRALADAFDRIMISIYGLDAGEYRTMTQRDEYERCVESLARLVRLARGNIVLGFRHLRRRTPEEVKAWVAEIEHRAGGAHTVAVVSDTREYGNWGVFDTSRPLPLEGAWIPSKENRHQCFIPALAAQVMVNGDVSFCNCANFDGNPGLVIGNVNERSLKEIYNSEECRRLWDWDRYGVPEFCKSCSFHQPMAHANIPGVFAEPNILYGA